MTERCENRREMRRLSVISTSLIRSVTELIMLKWRRQSGFWRDAQSIGTCMELAPWRSPNIHDADLYQ